MDVSQIREELHRYIDLADERVLNAIYDAIKDHTQKDLALEASIDKALEQAKKGEVLPHEKVMKKIRSLF